MAYINKASFSKNEHDSYYYRFSWFHLARPMTFTGTICPMVVGTGLAAEKGQIHVGIFIILLIAALLIQAATNMLNDYFDFKNGQDQEKWITLGDTSALHGPAHQAIPIVASSMILIAAVLGLWLAFHSSLWIILIGTFGILFGYLYSAGPRPLCSLGLGELVAAIFLGLATTILAYVVQGHPIDTQILAVSLPFALLIASMILTNNIRDIEKDHAFRSTLGIILGRRKAVLLLTALLTLAYMWVGLLMLFGVVFWMSGAVLIALPLAIKLRRSFHPEAKHIKEISCMKWAAWHHWAFGLLFGLGVWLGGF